MQQTKFVYERQMNGWSASEQARKKIEGGERERIKENEREKVGVREREAEAMCTCVRRTMETV